MKKILLIVLGILLIGSVSALVAHQNVTATILPGEIYIHSPVQNAVYPERMVLINLSMSSKVKYFKYGDNGGSLKTLCRECNSYSKKKPFGDGFHQLIIYGLFEKGNISHSINFLVDSKKPRIIRSEPKRDEVTNGSNFYIKYSEENLKEILINFNPSLVLSNCNESGKDKECFFDLDLTAYDGQYINYSFNVSDYIRSVQSKNIKVKVDTSSPIITIKSPLNSEYGKRILFDLQVNEKVKLQYSDNNENWRSLCTNCQRYNRTRFFKLGNHNVLIRAIDKAGNSDLEEINFVVA